VGLLKSRCAKQVERDTDSPIEVQPFPVLSSFFPLSLPLFSGLRFLYSQTSAVCGLSRPLNFRSPTRSQLSCPRHSGRRRRLQRRERNVEDQFFCWENSTGSFFRGGGSCWKMKTWLSFMTDDVCMPFICMRKGLNSSLTFHASEFAWLMLSLLRNKRTALGTIGRRYLIVVTLCFVACTQRKMGEPALYWKPVRYYNTYNTKRLRVIPRLIIIIVVGFPKMKNFLVYQKAI
jgi:hypothetical protein